MANTDDKTRVSADATSQAQSGSSEKDRREANKPEKKSDEIQFFDGTITKLVDREVEDENGDKHVETVEVISDNLYPGEKLKRADDEEKAKAKQDKARREAKKAAEARGTDK